MSGTTSNTTSEISRERSHLPLSEHFSRPLPASLGPVTETRLLQQHRRLFLRDSDTVIATSISKTGWIATATSSDIRLYDVDSQAHARGLGQHCDFSIKMQSKREKIRAVSLSDHLLAVVTHRRLLLYEYREPGKVQDNILEEVPIDLNEAWIPKSVSILEVESIDTLQRAAAWIAIGGEGSNAVKLYQYSMASGGVWSAQRNFRTMLKFPRNTSSIRNVGFSQFLRCDKFFVFGVTSDSRVVCWEVCPREHACPETLSRHDFDDILGQDTLSRRAEIAAVSLFQAPSGMPYMFCAVDQKHGSQQLQSFTAPLERSSMTNPSQQWRRLPEEAVGRHVVHGAVTRNGHFLVTVEDGSMKLLTSGGAVGGGITFQPCLEWEASLKATAKDVSVMSLSVREGEGGLDVTAVDGRGHVVFARVSVPEMPVSEPMSLVKPSSTAPVEMPAEIISRELHNEEIPRSIYLDGDATEDEIRVMLG